MLVLGYHRRPVKHTLAELRYLVFAAVAALGPHHQVVDALLGLLLRQVEDILPALVAHLDHLSSIHHTEVGVAGLAQRPIDVLARSVGHSLGFGLRTREHQRLALLTQLGDQLVDDVALRVHEGGFDLGPDAYHLVAHQVQGVATGTMATGNLDHAPGMKLALQLFPHTLRYGPDGHHGLQRVAGLRADIDIGIGTHHELRTARADIHIIGHGV